MTTPERTTARVTLLRQLGNARKHIVRTSLGGANYLMGVCCGTLMELQEQQLVAPAVVADLARQVKDEFDTYWPGLNSGFSEILDRLSSPPPKDTPHD